MSHSSLFTYQQHPRSAPRRRHVQHHRRQGLQRRQLGHALGHAEVGGVLRERAVGGNGVSGCGLKMQIITVQGPPAEPRYQEISGGVLCRAGVVGKGA